MTEKNIPEILFLSWAYNCSRSDNIARELGGKSYMVYYNFLGSNYFTVWLKYFLQMVKSLVLLLSNQPAVVFVMSPPIIACLPVYLYCSIFKKPYLIDAHTGAFLHPRWKNKKRLSGFFIKRALRTIVTNEHLGSIVADLGGNFFQLTDIPIQFPETENNKIKKNGAKYSVTMVNTFSSDEPVVNFVEAASKFNDVDFFVTGEIILGDKKVIANAPPNIHFTDFLSIKSYGKLLRETDLVCAFTTRDHTMLRGAYEAIYLGKPVVISDWKILQDNFPDGAIHVDNTIDGIAGGIRQALNNIDELTAGALLLRNRKMTEWLKVKRELLELIEKCKERQMGR